MGPLAGVLLGADQIFPQRNCSLTPLHYPRPLREGYHLKETTQQNDCGFEIMIFIASMYQTDFVGTDVELSGGSGVLFLEKSVDQYEYLLHHSVLPQIILPLTNENSLTLHHHYIIT